jgi:hypothetical protein
MHLAVIGDMRLQNENGRLFGPPVGFPDAQMVQNDVGRLIEGNDVVATFICPL